MEQTKINEMQQELKLLDVDEVIALTGWGESTVRKIMTEDENFPTIKIGKKNQVSFDGLKEYLSTRRIFRGE